LLDSLIRFCPAPQGAIAPDARYGKRCDGGEFTREKHEASICLVSYIRYD
jgi:hypothetical protein